MRSHSSTVHPASLRLTVSMRVVIGYNGVGSEPLSDACRIFLTVTEFGVKRPCRLVRQVKVGRWLEAGASPLFDPCRLVRQVKVVVG